MSTLTDRQSTGARADGRTVPTGTVSAFWCVEPEDGLREPRALQERSELLGGRRAHLVRVHLRRRPVAHEELAVDEDVTHRAGTAAEDDPREGIAPGSGEPGQIEHDEIGALAWLERADLVIEVEHLRAFACREEHRVRRAERSDAAHDPREERREPHLLEAVEAVVAGRAVGAEAHGDFRRAKLGDLRDARPELEIRRGAVRDRRA